MTIPNISIQSPAGQAAARTLLRELNIEESADNIAQFMVFLGALKVYNDRTTAYGQVWKQYGALSNLLSVARKVDRMMALWWHKAEEVLDEHGKVKPLLHKDNLDDAVDLLNYCVFFIRNASASNLYGNEPRRPTK